MPSPLIGFMLIAMEWQRSNICKAVRLQIAAAAFGTFFIVVNPAFAQSWQLTSAPSTNWQAVASSANGTKLVAVINNNLQLSFGPGVYVSTNSGADWTGNPIEEDWGASWTSVASSANGSNLVGLVYPGGPICTSTNGGSSWTISIVPKGNWTAIASSADGRKLVTVASIHFVSSGGGGTGPIPGGIYISTNSGLNWTPDNTPPFGWRSVASSADGNNLVVVGERIYTSTNSGASWASNSVPGTNWSSVASSADGTKLVAAANPGQIYTSTNSGAAWTLTIAPSNHWSGIASSADGTRLVAVTDGGPIYTSADSGATWISNNAPSANWSSVASSADGGKLVAVIKGGGIYTSQSTLAPLLNIAVSSNNLVCSWIVPSADFVLQQNSDLTTTNWTDVTNAPTLNLTNLQNQLILTPTNGSRFYRLKSP